MLFYRICLKINKIRPFCCSFQGGRFNFVALVTPVMHLVFVLLGFCGVLLGTVSVTGCNRDAHEKSGEQKCGTAQFEVVGSDYFSIGKLCGVDVAVVRSVVGKDTLVHKFVMMDSSTAALGTDLRRRSFPEEWLSAKVLQIPLKRVVALSTSQVGYLLRLGFRDNIVGVSDGNYIVDSVLYNRARPDHGRASDFVQSIGYDADALEKLAEVLEVPVSKLLGAPVEQPKDQNELAEQLSRLNEQLVIQNRYKEQSRKTVRTIFTVIGVIVAAGFIVILLCFILIMLLRVQNTQGPVSEQNTACISMEESFEDGTYAVPSFRP